MAKKRITAGRGASPGFPLGDKILAACVAAGVALALALVIALVAPARAHGEFDWVMPLSNPETREFCCGAEDCDFVPAEGYYRDGARYIVTVGGRVGAIPSRQVMATRDPEGRAVACLRPDGTIRCLFLPMGA